MSKSLDNLYRLRFLAICTELTTQAEVDELIKPIETALQEDEKKLKIMDLLFRKGVNIILLDYLHHINPDNAFETYNKEMRKAWCDLYELNRGQFNMIVDYIEEQKQGGKHK